MPDEDFYCLHSEICKTLANAKRQMILGNLRDQELTVGELQQRTGIPQAVLAGCAAGPAAARLGRSRRRTDAQG